MTNEELQDITESLSQAYFKRPFRHRCRFNGRLRTTGGRYLLTSGDIEINPKSYERFGKEEVIGIIKHELCHYHLHLEGKGYRHGDADFKNWLDAVGAARHCRLIEEKQTKAKYLHYYQCQSCRAEIKRKKRFNTERFVCGVCQGRLKKIKSIPKHTVDA